MGLLLRLVRGAKAKNVNIRQLRELLVASDTPTSIALLLEGPTDVKKFLQVIAFCDRNGDLARRLITLSGNAHLVLSWLSPAGGQKAAALLPWLQSRAGDVTQIWDPKQTCTAPAVTVPPSSQPKTVDDVIATATIGAAPPGFEGGRPWGLTPGRPGDAYLPQWKGSSQISYREYDVTYRQWYVNRGPRRVVVGSDGRKFYTDDHYRHFKLIT